MSKGIQNQWGWRGLTVAGARVLAVPKQRGLHSSVTTAALVLLATSKAWFSVGPAHCAHEPSLPPSPGGPLFSPSPMQSPQPLLPALLRALPPALPGISRRGCSRCPAEQHPRGTRCDVSLLPSSLPQDFAAFLRPSERTDIVLVAIEAMRDSSFFDKEAAGKMLDLVMRNPDFWLADVSGLWLDCPTLQPCQALLLPPSLPPSQAQV